MKQVGQRKGQQMKGKKLWSCVLASTLTISLVSGLVPLPVYATDDNTAPTTVTPASTDDSIAPAIGTPASADSAPAIVTPASGDDNTAPAIVTPAANTNVLESGDWNGVQYSIDTDYNLVLQGGTFTSGGAISSRYYSQIKTIKVADGQIVQMPQYSSELFSGLSALTTIDLSGFDFTGVEVCYDLFAGDTSLKSVDFTTAKNTDKANINDNDDMFGGCTSLERVDLNTLKLTDDVYDEMLFYNCPKLKEFKLPANVTTIDDINLPTPSSMLPYDGTWSCKEDPSLAALTTQELIAAYNSDRAPAGKTYVWHTSEAANNTFTVHFEPGNNVQTYGSMQDHLYVVGSTDTLPKNTKYYRPGYTFEGWATTQNATQALIKDEGSVEVLNGTKDQTITLYPVWKIIAYKLVYDYGDGKDAQNPTTYTVESPDIKLKVPQGAVGYGFMGWTVAGTKKDDGTFTPEPTQLPGVFGGYGKEITIPHGTTGDFYFTANYAVYNYHVTYVANLPEGMFLDPTYGNKNTPPTQNYTYFDKLTITDGTYDRRGFDFMGWSTTKDGTALYHAGDTIDWYKPTKFDDGLMLYAVWKSQTNTPTDFCVTYKFSDGTISQTVRTAGSKITMPADKGTPQQGYTFKGWSMVKASPVAQFEAGKTYNNVSVPGVNVTLYPVYVQNSTPKPVEPTDYGVVYNFSDGSLVFTTKKVGVPVTMPADTGAREGYTFLGWSDKVNATTAKYEYGKEYLEVSTPGIGVTLWPVYVKNAEVKPQPDPMPDPTPVPTTDPTPTPKPVPGAEEQEKPTVGSLLYAKLISLNDKLTTLTLLTTGDTTGGITHAQASLTPASNFKEANGLELLGSFEVEGSAANFMMRFNVGIMHAGKTATLYVQHKDGTTATSDAVVAADGTVSFAMDKLSVYSLVLHTAKAGGAGGAGGDGDAGGAGGAGAKDAGSAGAKDAGTGSQESSVTELKDKPAGSQDAGTSADVSAGTDAVSSNIKSLPQTSDPVKSFVALAAVLAGVGAVLVFCTLRSTHKKRV